MHSKSSEEKNRGVSGLGGCGVLPRNEGSARFCCYFFSPGIFSQSLDLARTCNRDAERIWLNSELVKKPIACIEYVIVHELLHLIEKKHNERFVALMTNHLPKWRSFKEELNRLMLAHEKWGACGY